MTPIAPRRVAIAVCVAALLSACGAAATPSPTPSATESPVTTDFSVTSADFIDGGDLDPRFSANAWGQCSGDNINPQLAWQNVPQGTVTFAITMIDRSAGNYVHWVHANIPADITAVATGGSTELPGLVGMNSAPTEGYFGPCPPGPNHRYEFQVWALDAHLEFEDALRIYSFQAAAADHILAVASITGMYSPAQ